VTKRGGSSHVGDHQVPVVLDNCEHLAGETALLTESLLAACPALTVLATSREALGVEGELNWQVPPLSLPKAGPGSDRGGTAAAPAGRRVADRGRRLAGGHRASP
jgi:predicted ATPase